MLLGFCPSGQQLESDKCVNCKRDKYKDNDEGATSKFGTCKACPTGKVSQKEGAKKNTECSQGGHLICMKKVHNDQTRMDLS